MVNKSFRMATSDRQAQLWTSTNEKDGCSGATSLRQIQAAEATRSLWGSPCVQQWTSYDKYIDDFYVAP